VAQGAEVLVATDHDHVTDYGPVVRERGRASELATVVGQEITSNVRSQEAPFTFGHANVFPLPYRPQRHRKGAIASEERRLRRVIADVRALGGERIVQLNHPRPSRDRLKLNALFTHLAVSGEPFDPKRPLTAAPNAALLEPDPATGVRDLDFDAIELWNGDHMGRYQRVREDWFALLRQGVVKTATANSDSHRLGEVAAAPRTYLEAKHDSAGAFDEAELVRALREGRVFGTSGPIPSVRLGEARIGDRYAGRAARLLVEVRAAPWVPVARVRVYVDGWLAREAPIERNASAEFALTFEHDTFVTVEVEGDPDPRFGALLPYFTPFAFTNPIFVDADSDGAWSPHGALVLTPSP
jgi:hypothetical protein